MLVVKRPQTDPYFNMAAEEYLLKHSSDDLFMLWINQPSVIIGKHQNAFAEINSGFVESEDIPVIRRISGGGTVFHDQGNLNFSFIQKGEREKLIDFQRFTKPIIAYLQELGIPARFEGKNDIRVHGLKISGNAEHVYKDRVLHHGTLLFNSGLALLNRAIRGQESRYNDKAVKSVRSTVANITDFLEKPMTIEAFKEGIERYVVSQLPESTSKVLSESETEAINKLALAKYKSWEWNFGYSPRFTFRKEIRFEGRTVIFEAQVKDGLVAECKIMGIPGIQGAPGYFLGCRFERQAFRERLNHGQDNPVLDKIVDSIFDDS